MVKFIKQGMSLLFLFFLIGCHQDVINNIPNEKDNNAEDKNHFSDALYTSVHQTEEIPFDKDGIEYDCIGSWDSIYINNKYIDIKLCKTTNSDGNNDAIISIDDSYILCDNILTDIILDTDNIGYAYEIFDADGDGQEEFVLLVRNDEESIGYVSAFLILKYVNLEWCISDFPYLCFDSGSEFVTELKSQNFDTSCDIKYVVANAIMGNLGITYYIYSDKYDGIIGNISLPMEYDDNNECYYAGNSVCELYYEQTELDDAYEVYYTGEAEFEGVEIPITIYCKDRFNVVFKIDNKYVRINPEIACMFSDVGYVHPEFIFYDITGDGKDEIIVVLHGGASGSRCAMHVFTKQEDDFKELNVSYEYFVYRSDFWNMIDTEHSDGRYRLAYNPVFVDEDGLYISYIFFEEDAEDISQRTVNVYLEYDESIGEVVVSDIVEQED